MNAKDREKPTEAMLVARRDRTTLAVVTVLLGLSVWLWGLRYPARIAWPLDRDEARLARVRQGIDPNAAQWFELAQLPGIGESLARRIIEFRDRQAVAAAASMGGGQVVFHRAADLVQVKGIGPKIVQRMGPFLRFPDP